MGAEDMVRERVVLVPVRRASGAISDDVQEQAVAALALDGESRIAEYLGESLLARSCVCLM